MIIAGTIRQSVQLSTMNSLIEEKKTKGFQKEQEEMTPEERMVEQYKEELAQNREAEKTNGIVSKVLSGRTLSKEEIEYLEQKNPEMLKKYREMQAEMKAYEKQLRNCKTKEEVERVRVNKINGYLTQAKSVSNNPVVPKSEKKAILEEIMARISNMEKVHMRFVKSVEYENLPEEQEIAKERAKLTREHQEAATEMLKEAGRQQEEIIEMSKTAGGQEEVAEIHGEAGGQEEDIAGKAMTLIQTALTRLSENSYSSTGGSVTIDLNRGKVVGSVYTEKCENQYPFFAEIRLFFGDFGQNAYL